MDKTTENDWSFIGLIQVFSIPKMEYQMEKKMEHDLERGVTLIRVNMKATWAKLVTRARKDSWSGSPSPTSPKVQQHIDPTP